MKFSIIICGYNEEENLDLCISSCIEQNYDKKNYEVIYVDNNSKDKSLEVAKKYPIKVLVEKKQGLSEARNCGIKNSKGEILVFFDADAKMDKNYLKDHEKTFSDKKVGAGGGKVLPLVKTIISDYLGVSLFESYPRGKKRKYMNTYPGCNLTITRKVLEEVGYFQEKMVSGSGITRFAEDKEICIRIRQAGYKILYNPLPIVYHKNTYIFKVLFNIWVKGSKGRANMIKLGKKDVFSLLFRYNLPLVYLLILILSVFINPIIFYSLFGIALLGIFGISFLKYLETGLFFQSLIVKPILDSISMIIINISVLKFRLMK